MPRIDQVKPLRHEPVRLGPCDFGSSPDLHSSAPRCGDARNHFDTLTAQLDWSHSSFASLPRYTTWVILRIVDFAFVLTLHGPRDLARP
jgi:hypothetical protein